MKTNKPTKLVVIESYGPITELGGINGPVLNPAKIELDIIIRMINKRKKIFEVNPNNYSERVQLTLKNVKANNFPTKKPASVVTPTVTAPAPTVSKDTKKEETVVEKKEEEKLGDFVE